jgi:AAA15 family ATPase/GTPase
VALYGANGSGKTTVLRALEFVVDMMRNSVQQTRPGFSGCERFNDV